MLKLLFKTTVYFIIWQKFKKHLLTIIISLVLIGLTDILYEDLYRVFKISNKEDIGLLLFFKWLIISIIVGVNIYILRKTKVDKNEIETNLPISKNDTNISRNKNKILRKKEILSTSDLILKKYTN